MQLRYAISTLRASLAPEHVAGLMAAGRVDGGDLLVESDNARAVNRIYEPDPPDESPKIVPRGTTPQMARAASTMPVERRQATVAAPTASAPLPPSKWPNWAKAISLLSRAEDRGVGDTVARIIGPATSAAFKAWHLATFGRPCGCQRRREEWNERFPYPIQKTLTSPHL